MSKYESLTRSNLNRLLPLAGVFIVATGCAPDSSQTTVNADSQGGATSEAQGALGYLATATLTEPLTSSEVPVLRPREAYATQMRTFCEEDTSRRGEIDPALFKACMWRQNRGYDFLAEAHQYAQSAFFAEVALPYCTKKWTKRGMPQLGMIGPCVQDEIEGLKDIIYFRQQYGEKPVNAIVQRTLTTSSFKRWQHAAWNVKDQFEK